MTKHVQEILQKRRCTDADFSEKFPNLTSFVVPSRLKLYEVITPADTRQLVQRRGISEEEAAARKKAYIDKAWSVCQVRLNPDRIKYNAGLRYVAKLCLNSLWGRFALRNRLTKTEIIDNHADLAKLLNDDKIEISSIDQLTEKFWMVCYKAKDEHVVEHDTSNVALALWTTSAARIHLLDSLQKVSRAADGTARKDTRVLYMDTDSIFYEYETALGDPAAWRGATW
uniref:DNA-directed DNA polymerase n=1 Tax=Globodera pallida TaxID=36090 RepID=A0A183C7T1_GLOPA